MTKLVLTAGYSFSLQLGGKVTAPQSTYNPTTVLLFFSSLPFFLPSPLLFFSLAAPATERESKHYSNPRRLNRDYTYGGLKWLIKKKSDKLIHRHGWMSEVTPHSSRALCVSMCGLVFNSIPGTAAQSYGFFLLSSAFFFSLSFLLVSRWAATLPPETPSLWKSINTTWSAEQNVCVCVCVCVCVWMDSCVLNKHADTYGSPPHLSVRDCTAVSSSAAQVW